jgi:hypothetical protein
MCVCVSVCVCVCVCPCMCVDLPLHSRHVWIATLIKITRLMARVTLMSLTFLQSKGKSHTYTHTNTNTHAHIHAHIHLHTCLHKPCCSVPPPPVRALGPTFDT